MHVTESGGARKRSRILSGLAAAAVTMFAVGLWVAPSAQAHADNYAWGPCNQRTKLFQSNLSVVAATTSPLPATGYSDSVTNSARDRLRDAVVQWNDFGINTGYGGGVTYDMVYNGNSDSGNIVVDSRDVGSALGITVLPSRCLSDVHSTSRQQLPSTVRITMDNRGDWFTQVDSRRGLWENCRNADYMPAYTCSKTQDMGQVFVHELGHALGIVDIEDHLVPHLGGNRTPLGSSYANCGSPTDYASMCNFPTYRSAGRSLHVYDQITLQRTIG